MESARFDGVWDEVIAPPRGGILPFAARLLLLVLIPLTIVWLPLTTLPGMGTVTASDAALMALWGIVAFDLIVFGALGLEHHTVTILVLAVVIAVLAGLGGELGPEHGTGAREFQLIMKKFGLAAVIPLAAVRFRSPAVGTWTRIFTLAGIAALVMFAVKPELTAMLPRPEDFGSEPDPGERSIGLGTNPNDLAYTAVALAVLHGAFAAGRRDLVSRGLLVAALACAAACVVASGSRSGLLGGGAALAFCVASTRIRLGAKLVLIGIAVAAVVVGLSMSSVFQERLTRLATYGARERNVSARLDAQWSAARHSLDHPFGVGFRNIAWGTYSEHSWAVHTTDSVYFDTLMGAGFPGLLALLFLFWTCWRHVTRAGAGAPGVPILHSGIVAFLMFGMATVVPISVFLSPLFFLVVSGASHATRDDT
jgi:O-antigen ligase